MVEAVAPTISLFAQKKVVRCGPLGAGHAVKAVNNCLNVAHLALAAEGLLALAAQGVAPDVVRKNPLSPLSPSLPLPLSPAPSRLALRSLTWPLLILRRRWPRSMAPAASRCRRRCVCRWRC